MTERRNPLEAVATEKAEVLSAFGRDEDAKLKDILLDRVRWIDFDVYRNVFRRAKVVSGPGRIVLLTIPLFCWKGSAGRCFIVVEHLNAVLGWEIRTTQRAIRDLAAAKEIWILKRFNGIVQLQLACCLKEDPPDGTTESTSVVHELSFEGASSVVSEDKKWNVETTELTFHPLIKERSREGENVEKRRAWEGVWAHVLRQMSHQIEPEMFDRCYKPIQVLDLSAEGIVLGIPLELVQLFGDDPQRASRGLKNRINESCPDFVDGRVIDVMLLR